MTKQEIKQRAEEYANKVNAFAEDESTYLAAKDGYISGAHSRDEEILKLQENIGSMETYIKAEKDCMQDEIDKMQEQLKMNAENIQKLRKPWISVEERLPEEETDNISIPVAAITNKGYWFKGQYDYDNKDWFFSEDPDHLDFETDEFVTHWMPIPKVKPFNTQQL